ncbi:KAP family P-loop NTPase fold protein [Actinoplanes sp. HUAS TT8]|uniref:KAP family P-loop NTPase fold protein n=1 Tax=Actinoplanes sp. HUAS TT8 TaxID=3447453 RepID=UPI003F51DAD3
MAKVDPRRLLHAGDLVEDREVADVGSDQLSHAQIADQLGELVRMVPAPSNVALYGPWGSGKSGIGNLLRDAIDGTNGIRFVRFDAFKYAETPLRRNFVSAIATELKITDDAFHDALYSGHSRTEVKVPAAKILKIMGVFATLVAGMSTILVGIVAMIALFQNGPYGSDFSTMCRTAVTAGLLPVALLSALVTLANKTLQVDRSIGKPDSDEQFEKIFKKLVVRSKAKRLVIFVDELDRCAADEVVATLDAIRTFLGVELCVFVIAADQRVLEESLTRAARQETPSDEINPYYSTGSAYLDKVFQYQVSLPPLMSQRVTRFAADTVKNRPGLWSDINSDYVVSVLVPTHVTSPRRVKHLINTFALTYRLAQDRYRLGLLAEDPRVTAAAVAKLVCLRVEFPLFARDLEIDFRLPEMVIRIAGDTTVGFDSSYSDQAVERARAYGVSRATPAMVVLNTEDNKDDEDAARRVGAQSNRQLLDYLRRTKTIPGPSRDLIFMHSGGTAFGLDGQTALAIEAAAENADMEAVTHRLDGADQQSILGIVQLLNHIIRTGIGVGGPNAARTLLEVYQNRPALPVESIADSASEMITIFIETDPELINSDTIDAAWQLAGLGKEAGALRLRDSVLAIAATEEHDLDASFVLRNPTPALTSNPDVLARLIAREIVRDGGESSIDLLRELDESTALAVINTSSQDIANYLSAAIDARNEFLEGHSVAASQPPTTSQTGRSTQLEVDEPFDPDPILNALQKYALDWASNSGNLSHALALILLRVDRRVGRDKVDLILAHIPAATNFEVVDALLTATTRRVLPLWHRWLSAIAPDSITDRHAASIRRLAMKLWANAKDNDVDLEDIETAASAVAGIIDQLPQGLRPDLTSIAISDVAEAAWNNDLAAKRTVLYRNVRKFADLTLLKPAPVYREALTTLSETFENLPSSIAADSPLGRYLLGDVIDIVRTGNPGNEDAPVLIKNALTQLNANSPAHEPFSTNLMLQLIGASGISPNDFESMPVVDDMIDVINGHGIGATAAAEEWLAIAKPDTDELARLFATLRNNNALTRKVAVAAVSARSHWARQQRLDFLRAHISEPDSSAPTVDEAIMIGLTDVDDNDVTDLIIERFQKCTNNSQRKTAVRVLAQARINDANSRRRLIEEMVLPMLNPAGASPQAGLTEIALDTLFQIGPPLPHGVKKALGEAAKRAVSGSESLERKALKVLSPLGYPVEQSGWFFRKKKVKYTD